MIKRFLFHVLANAAAFLLSDLVLTGVGFQDNMWIVVLAVLVFGFINTFVKPVVTLLSLPAIIFSLGIFYLIVNGLMLWFVSALVPGFEITGLWTAVAMGLIVSLVNWILNWMVEDDEKALKV
ncbi:phage holin family protein [Patescibacteria group bacterium]|nr:phage holin family protein [Patescibacteria group bacterium]